MNTSTISERLFEDFCTANAIEFVRIAVGRDKSPDYELHLPSGLVIAEVKQLDPNETDLQILQDMKSRSSFGYFPQSDERIRRKIQAANKQLKPHCKERSIPAILVLYCNTWVGNYDSTDVKTAMYGDETVVLGRTKDNPAIEPVALRVGFGKGRTTTPAWNTTLSAVASLRNGDGSPELNVYHNVHARTPLDASWIRGERVRHFTLTPETEGTFQEWHRL